MSGKLISVAALLSILSSVAVALIVTPSDFGASGRQRAYATRADFDWAFSQFEADSAFDSESIAAGRERLHSAGVKEMNLEQSGERPNWRQRCGKRGDRPLTIQN
jgi:hypothetical protein